MGALELSEGYNARDAGRARFSICPSPPRRTGPGGPRAAAIPTHADPSSHGNDGQGAGHLHRIPGGRRRHRRLRDVRRSSRTIASAPRRCRARRRLRESRVPWATSMRPPAKPSSVRASRFPAGHSIRRACAAWKSGWMDARSRRRSALRGPMSRRSNPKLPSNANGGFEFTGDFSAHPSPPGVDRRTLSIVAIAKDGRETVIGRRSLIEPGGARSAGPHSRRVTRRRSTCCPRCRASISTAPANSTRSTHRISPRRCARAFACRSSTCA